MSGAYLVANSGYDGAGTTNDDLKWGPAPVVKVGPGDYRMWYEGVSSINNSGDANCTDTLVSYATSADGLTWTRYGSNPLVPYSQIPTWMHGECSPGTVLYDTAAGIWKMWGHGGNNKFGSFYRKLFYATSPDGITWTIRDAAGQTNQNASWILDVGGAGAFDEEFVSDARVIKLPNGNYIGTYRGDPVPPAQSTQMGLMTSNDGITWTKYGGNPVLPVGAGGTWDDGSIYDIAMIYDPVLGVLHGWYGGDSRGDNGGEGLGYVFSEDLGQTWTRSSFNKLYGVQASGIDTAQVGDTIVVYVDGNNYRISYGSEKNVPPYFRGRTEVTVPIGAINAFGWNSLPSAAAGNSDPIPNKLYGDHAHSLEITIRTGGTAPVTGGYCELWLVPSVDGTTFAATSGVYVKPLILPGSSNTSRIFTVDTSEVFGLLPPWYVVRIVNRAGQTLNATGNSLVIIGRHA